MIAPTMTVRMRDHDRDDRAIDEELGHRSASCLAETCAATTLTTAPSRTFNRPSTIDAFAGFQSVGHDPELSDAVADRHRADRHLVVAAHDRDLVAALQLGDGALRNQQGAGSCPSRRGGRARIRRGEADCWGSGKHRRSGSRRSPRLTSRSAKEIVPGVFIDASIAEQSAAAACAFAASSTLCSGRKPAMEIDELLLADREVGFDRDRLARPK